MLILWFTSTLLLIITEFKPKQPKIILEVLKYNSLQKISNKGNKGWKLF